MIVIYQIVNNLSFVYNIQHFLYLFILKLRFDITGRTEIILKSTRYFIITIIIIIITNHYYYYHYNWTYYYFNYYFITLLNGTLVQYV